MASWATPPRRTPSRARTWLTPIGRAIMLSGVVAVFWWAGLGLRIDPERLRRGLPAIANVFRMMFSPRFGKFTEARTMWMSGLLAVTAAGVLLYAALRARSRQRQPVGTRLLMAVIGAALVLYGFADRDWLLPVAEGVGQSFAIALIGTTLGALAAVPLAFLATRNIVVYTVVAWIGRQLSNAIRSFPEVVLAVFFVASYGPGPLAGALAIGLHSAGTLGRLYADIIENVDTGPTEALQAAGASRLELFWFAVLPQILPEAVATGLYRLEINMRAAHTLGLVGAGGIGVILLQALTLRRWSIVGTALLVIIIGVTLIDVVSAELRKRLI